MKWFVVCTASDDILSFHSIELQATREIPDRLSPSQVMKCLLCSSLVAMLHLMGSFLALANYGVIPYFVFP